MKKFNLKEAEKICNGLFAVTDSIVEYYESEAVKMFPAAVAEIKILRASKGQKNGVWVQLDINDRQEAILRAIKGLTDPNYHHSPFEEQCADILEDMLKEAEEGTEFEKILKHARQMGQTELLKKQINRRIEESKKHKIYSIGFVYPTKV